ncbi:hypothetical protein LB572_03035 [Mesorhizobium sp. BH1-1-5]|uniref:hypothetical protein n=1 Tax=Mesorhizobium sp. BH1-1-5 TaxID=2876661 RepID=UPI001CCCC829|nr:hypothetical protein [Mesorhizobium sp. BH1-1-5]MBZ9986067.1 hypothetical protein [Mesorhizobium sp. BH1-1-5]
MSAHISDIVSRDDLTILAEEEVRKLVAKYELAEHFDPYRYVPPGPVAQAFILSTALTKVIMGPLGGGKTTTCAFARIYAATMAPVAWHPEDRKPTRMCRWIVLRDTFRSAEKTVLESWKQWFPKGYPGSTWTGGNDRPVTHVLRFIGADGVRIEAITEFAGLGEASIETLMKGREYSGAWPNELDTHAPGALDDLEQRVGRYPKSDILLTQAELVTLARQLGKVSIASGPRMRFVIGDMNAPTIDNWTYKAFVTNKKPDRLLFRQPSGRSVDAENRFNLEADYYDRIIRNQEEHFVKRMVDNEFGYSRSGKPVLSSFSYFRHVAGGRLDYRPELDLHIGVDASTSGLSPAAIFAQSWAPRLAFVDELYLGHGVGTARFGEGLKKKIDAEYPDAKRVLVWVDPAAQYGADKEGGQLAALELLSVILGLPVMVPANGSNELGMRIDAINSELRGYLEPHSHLIVCPEKCPLWLEGAAGKYRFRKKPENSGNEYDDTPEKLHPWSDLQDAGQYVTLGIRGRAAAIRGAATGRGQGERAGGNRWGSQAAGGDRRPAPKERGGFNPHKF